MTILAHETSLSRCARTAGLALLLAPDWRDDEILLGRWARGFVDGEGCFGAYEDNLVAGLLSGKVAGLWPGAPLDAQ